MIIKRLEMLKNKGFWVVKLLSCSTLYYRRIFGVISVYRITMEFYPGQKP